jgi:hypothetical protein
MMILYEFDMASAASSRVTGVEVGLGTNGDEVGIAEDEVEVEVEEPSSNDVDDVDEGEANEDEEEVDEGVGDEVGIADSVVGKLVTVINVPEAAGAFRTVAESRGRMVDARWRQ